MNLADLLLVAVLVVLFPAWEFWRGPVLRARLMADPALKVAAYRTTCIQLWSLTLVLLALHASSGLSIAALAVREAPWFGAPLVAATLVPLALYLAWSLRSVAGDPAVRKQTAEAMQPLAWMLPNDRREAIWFIGPVSLTAGICEELLYRGYLMQWLAGFIPVWAAMLLSSAVFGLMHAYQGPGGILRTVGLGLVMAGLFVLTGSLLWPILLHVVIDAYAGALSWLAMRKEITAEPDKNGATPCATRIR
ncbi:CPBP family intramembrane glutamic endopeptidase [Wenzhouxiangella sediminis]|nr:type II CAAX endopeptidase family protein [Wenzhouxiangella sediminis]